MFNSVTSAILRRAAAPAFLSLSFDPWLDSWLDSCLSLSLLDGVWVCARELLALLSGPLPGASGLLFRLVLRRTMY